MILFNELLMCKNKNFKNKMLSMKCNYLSFRILAFSSEQVRGRNCGICQQLLLRGGPGLRGEGEWHSAHRGTDDGRGRSQGILRKAVGQWHL